MYRVIKVLSREDDIGKGGSANSKNIIWKDRKGAEKSARRKRKLSFCHVEMDCDWKYNNNTINNGRCGIV